MKKATLKRARSSSASVLSVRTKSTQEKIIRKAAKDFATRFETVMRELANG